MRSSSLSRCFPGWSASIVWALGPALHSVPMIGATAEPDRGLAHGLWVWKSPDVLGAPHGAERLKDFCESQGISEIYVSYSAATAAEEESAFTHLIGLLLRSNIRVEALLSIAARIHHPFKRDLHSRQFCATRKLHHPTPGQTCLGNPGGAAYSCPSSIWSFTIKPPFPLLYPSPSLGRGSKLRSAFAMRAFFISGVTDGSSSD
jgi:hypothetical protein